MFGTPIALIVATSFHNFVPRDGVIGVQWGYFTITGAKKIARYTEDFVISRFHCTWTILVCPSSAVHFIQSTNLTRTFCFSNDCSEVRGGGVGLRSTLQERKKKKKGKFQSRKITNCKRERRKKRKIPKPENYERKNFNVLPVSKDLNTRTNSMTKDQ